MLLSEDNFSKITNAVMGNFVHFWGYNDLSFHIAIDIELYTTEKMQIRLSFIQNIDIWPIYGLKSTKLNTNLEYY